MEFSWFYKINPRNQHRNTENSIFFSFPAAVLVQTALEKKLNNSPLESSCGHNAGVIWKNRYFLPKISEMIKKYNIWRMVVAISWSNQWDWMSWNFLPEFCFFSPHHSPPALIFLCHVRKKKKIENISSGFVTWGSTFIFCGSELCNSEKKNKKQNWIPLGFYLSFAIPWNWILLGF